MDIYQNMNKVLTNLLICSFALAGPKSKDQSSSEQNSSTQAHLVGGRAAETTPPNASKHEQYSLRAVPGFAFSEEERNIVINGIINQKEHGEELKKIHERRSNILQEYIAQMDVNFTIPIEVKKLTNLNLILTLPSQGLFELFNENTLIGLVVFLRANPLSIGLQKFDIFPMANQIKNITKMTIKAFELFHNFLDMNPGAVFAISNFPGVLSQSNHDALEKAGWHFRETKIIRALEAIHRYPKEERAKKFAEIKEKNSAHSTGNELGFSDHVSTSFLKQLKRKPTTTAQMEWNDVYTFLPLSTPNIMDQKTISKELSLIESESKEKIALVVGLINNCLKEINSDSVGITLSEEMASSMFQSLNCTNGFISYRAIKTEGNNFHDIGFVNISMVKDAYGSIHDVIVPEITALPAKNCVHEFMNLINFAIDIIKRNSPNSPIALVKVNGIDAILPLKTPEDIANKKEPSGETTFHNILTQNDWAFLHSYMFNDASQILERKTNEEKMAVLRAFLNTGSKKFFTLPQSKNDANAASLLTENHFKHSVFIKRI